MSYFQKKFTFKRKIKYFLFVLTSIWLILTIIIIYQYFINSSKEIVPKWWTFVEWIFDTTSFLPYLSNSSDSLFYQWLLFESCLKQKVVWNNKLEFEDSICHVTTKDYKTYFVSLSTWKVWSNWIPVSIDDVFFTYNDVLVNNIRMLNTLKKYWKVKVYKESDKIKVVFEKKWIDNNVFFTNYILPKHALLNVNLQDYKNSFSIEPIYTNCAKIMSQSTDQYSLIFDLSNCLNSHLWYYQIKNVISFHDFENSIKLWPSIVDAYIWEKLLSGYSTKKLLTNRNISIFFNTKSSKLRIRQRRALWWLIYNNFYISSWYESFFSRYSWELFNKFLSTWLNIKDFLSRTTTSNLLAKWDLKDIWIKKLPKPIIIKWNNEKLVYYAEDINNRYTMQFKFEQKYKKISISYNNWWEYIPKSYNSKLKTAKYNIWYKLWNYKVWINKYTIYWFTNDWKKEIAAIDLYNLKWWWTLPIWNVNNTKSVWSKITVIYKKTDSSEYIVKRLQKIFSDNDILSFFNFVWFDSYSEFEWKLLVWDYDIVINVINMNFKQDISKIFKTDNIKINHSQYSNFNFIKLLWEYANSKWSDKKNIVSQLNNIYGTDMPFLMIWYEYKNLYIKDSVLKKYIWTWVFHEYNWREKLNKNLVLTTNVNIDVKKLWNFEKFINFIKEVKWMWVEKSISKVKWLSGTVSTWKNI